jgi:hypothetical protein
MIKHLIIVGCALTTVVAACGGDEETAAAEVAAPTGLKVEFLGGGAHITWKDNSDDESEFMIERRAERAKWSTVATVPFDTTQYHDAEISPSTTYTYRVLAMPKSGDHSAGAYSGEVTFVAPEEAGGSDEDGAAGADGAHSGHGQGSE